MYERHQRGKWAEDLAWDFYQQRNFRLLQRNFTSYWGEIDLILEAKKEIVFVEVRLRRDAGYGDGLQSVTPKKQKRILKTALYFLQRHPAFSHHPCRFDVLAVNQQCATDAAEILWIPGAFDASSL